jgi:hypothetical protein
MSGNRLITKTADIIGSIRDHVLCIGRAAVQHFLLFWYGSQASHFAKLLFFLLSLLLFFLFLLLLLNSD